MDIIILFNLENYAEIFIFFFTIILSIGSLYAAENIESNNWINEELLQENKEIFNNFDFQNYSFEVIFSDSPEERKYITVIDGDWFTQDHNKTQTLSDMFHPVFLLFIGWLTKIEYDEQYKFINYIEFESDNEIWSLKIDNFKLSEIERIKIEHDADINNKLFIHEQYLKKRLLDENKNIHIGVSYEYPSGKHESFQWYIKISEDNITTFDILNNIEIDEDIDKNDIFDFISLNDMRNDIISIDMDKNNEYISRFESKNFIMELDIRLLGEQTIHPWEENNINKTLPETIKAVILSRNKLKKDPKLKKYIIQVDAFVGWLEDVEQLYKIHSKLEKVLKKLENDTSRMKYLIDYLSWKIKLKIINLENNVDQKQTINSIQDWEEEILYTKSIPANEKTIYFTQQDSQVRVDILDGGDETESIYSLKNDDDKLVYSTQFQSKFIWEQILKLRNWNEFILSTDSVDGQTNTNIKIKKWNSVSNEINSWGMIITEIIEYINGDILFANYNYFYLYSYEDNHIQDIFLNYIQYNDQQLSYRYYSIDKVNTDYIVIKEHPSVGDVTFNYKWHEIIKYNRNTRELVSRENIEDLWTSINDFNMNNTPIVTKMVSIIPEDFWYSLYIWGNKHKLINSDFIDKHVKENDLTELYYFNAKVKVYENSYIELVEILDV